MNLDGLPGLVLKVALETCLLPAGDEPVLHPSVSNGVVA